MIWYNENVHLNEGENPMKLVTSKAKIAPVTTKQTMPSYQTEY